jgi:hypothetical protein
MSRARRDEHREVVSSEGQIGVLSGLRAVCRVHGGVWAARGLIRVPSSYFLNTIPRSSALKHICVAELLRAATAPRHSPRL